MNSKKEVVLQAAHFLNNIEKVRNKVIQPTMGFNTPLENDDKIHFLDDDY